MSKLPRFWIEHAPDWRNEPLAYWVHVEQGPGHWRAATEYAPPAPKPDGKKGYRVLCVEAGDVVLRFSSDAQLAEFVRVLSQKPLPTSLRLSRQRGPSVGPNGHWLSRLPARLKSPKARIRLVSQLSALAGRIDD
ncbi:hypothetical protein [Arenimonas sp.]|uniref:hypothetical protein n=1 Tax=Arenimonas sp. TaxID=1872635 RepID=UPI0039E21B1F